MPFLRSPSFYLITFLVLIHLPGLTQPTYYRTNYLTLEDGLSHTEINRFYKDSQGFMWIGTYDGLNKFNSVDIQVFKPEQTFQKGNGLDLVESILEDRYGNLWLGLHGGGIYIYDRLKDDFISFTDQLVSDSIERHELELVSAIEFDASGNVWFGGENGLSFYNVKTKTLKRYLFPNSEQLQKRTFSNEVRDIYCANDNSVWISTNHGLRLLDPTTGEITEFLPPFLADGEYFDTRGLEVDSKGNLYVASFKYGIWMVRKSDQSFEPFLTPENSISTVQSFHIDKWDRMWIGEQNRLYIYDLRSNGFIDPKALNIASDDLNNTFAAINSDENGIVWLGRSGKGIVILDPYTNPFISYLSVEQKTILNSKIVTSFCDVGDGRIFVGTDGGGLYIWNENDDTFTALTEENSGINDNTILSLAKYHDKLLIGTYEGGLNVLDLKTLDFINYTKDVTESTGIKDDDVRAILVDERDQIWIGTNKQGLYKFNLKTGEFEYVNLGIENGAIALTLDNKGNLWIGCYNGLKVLNRQTYEYAHFFNNTDLENPLSYDYVTDIRQSIDDKIYVTTLGGGVNVFVEEDSSFIQLNKENGLADNHVGFVVEDNDGFLWFGTANGLSKYNSSSGEFVNFRVEDGLSTNQFSKFGSAGVKKSDGTLLLGTYEGFIQFSPPQIQDFSLLPKIVINGIKVFHRQSFDHVRTFRDFSAPIIIPYKEGNFTISFDGINYSSLGNIEFRYLMKNYTNEWFSLGKQHSIQFSKMPAGEYEFLLQATSNGLQWTEPTKIQILVLKPYWLELWFICLVILLLIAGIYGIYRYRIASVRRQNIKLSKLVSERTLELSEKNNQLIEYAKKIKEQSNDIEAVNEELISQNEEILTQRDNLENQTKVLDKAKRELDAANAKLLELNKSLENQVKKRTSKLTKVNKDLDRFVYSASHELVAPIKSLKGLVSLIKIDKDYNPAHYVDLIDKSIDKLDTVIKSLLQFSRNKQVDIQLKKALLHPMVDEIFAGLNFIDDSIELLNNVDGSLEINVDVVRLKVVLNNLINNAIKYHDDTRESKYVRVSAMVDSKDIIIAVEDNGSGIEASNHDRIFEMYYRGAEASDGSGLGLYLVKEYISKMKGKIHVDSEVGKGSSFSISLPK